MFETISCNDLAVVTGGTITPPEPTPPPPLDEPRLDLPASSPELLQQPPTREPWLPVAPDLLPG